MIHIWISNLYTMDLWSPEKYNRGYVPKTPFFYFKVAITFFLTGAWGQNPIFGFYGGHNFCFIVNLRFSISQMTHTWISNSYTRTYEAHMNTMGVTGPQTPILVFKVAITFFSNGTSRSTFSQMTHIWISHPYTMDYAAQKNTIGAMGPKPHFWTLRWP